MEECCLRSLISWVYLIVRYCIPAIGTASRLYALKRCSTKTVEKAEDKVLPIRYSPRSLGHTRSRVPHIQETLDRKWNLLRSSTCPPTRLQLCIHIARHHTPHPPGHTALAPKLCNISSSRSPYGYGSSTDHQCS